jgi:hypothetical protein
METPYRRISHEDRLTATNKVGRAATFEGIFESHGVLRQTASSENLPDLKPRR